MRLLRLALVTALAASPALITLRAQEIVPASAGASATAKPFLKAGDVAPEFSVVGPKGETIKLSDYRGKIVVVDISATWCGPCQAAMPNNDRVFKKYADQGVVLLGVTADDSREAYDGWIKRSVGKYTFTMTFDLPGKAGWKDSVFNTDYRVTGFPTMFVVGRDGKILETVSGGGPGDDYRLEYALARAGVKVDLAAIPPEPKRDPGAKSIPLVAKTAATPAGGGMIGMGSPTKRGEPIPSKFGSVAARDMVPDFTVTGVDGAPVKLASFAGKPVLVHFVSSGMGPQPWFSKILTDYKESNFSTLVIFAATERADFDKWVAANPNPGFTVAWDPAGKAWAEGVTNTHFGVGMFPASFVATAEGKLVSGTIGMGDKVATMIKMMLVAAKAITPTETDLAAMRTYVQSVMSSGGGGGMAAATKSAAAPVAALLAAGTVAPDFVMHDINGKQVKLSEFKGKVVILDFWATWCGPCIASFPHTEKIAATYKDQDVIVVASGTSDTIAKFKEWIPKNQPKYPTLQFYFDPNERDSATFADRASSKLYHVSGIPTQFVIGRDGVIVAAIVGNGGDGDTRTEGALAKAGVKVDAAVAAKGAEALAADIAKRKASEAAAADEVVNPKPAFRENYGKLKKGEPVAVDIPLQTVDGQATKLSEVTKGKTVVLNIWSGSNGPNGDWLTFTEEWSRKYADQGVMFLSMSSYSTREDFDKWRTAQAGKFTFPVVWDSAGPVPRASKPMDELTAEEKKAHSELSKAYFPKNGAMALTGGAMAPVPHNIVLDSQGNLLGFYGGAGPGTKDSLANLLLRGGVKLAAEDMPKKVFTAEDTKPEVPEARVEMLKVGAVAPDFTTTDINGKTVKISDYKGKVVILDFWAPWCGPCIASMPHTNEVAATYKDQGVVVLGSCTSDTRANFDKWVKANQEKYPDFIFSHDAAERTPDRASRKLYGVSGIPTQFIIDRVGKIAAISIGYMKGEVLLEGALAKAGIKVDAAILAKAVEDQKKRDAR